MGGDTHEKKRKNPSPPGFLVGCMVSVAHVCVGCTCKLLAAPGYIHLLCTNVLIENCCLHMCVVVSGGGCEMVFAHVCDRNLLLAHDCLQCEGNDYKLAFAYVTGCKLLFSHVCDCKLLYVHGCL